MDHVLTYFGRQIGIGSQKLSRITRQKTCCASESNTSVRVVFANRSGFDALIGVVFAWEKRGSCINIFRTKNSGRISETFTNYEAKTCCASESNTSVRVVFVNRNGFDAPIVVDMKPSRIKRQMTCCASVSNPSVRVVFATRSGFDGIVLAWDERGSCLNILRTTNGCRILETFTNHDAKDLLRKSEDHVLTYSGEQIAVGSQKPSRIKRQKTCCASESNRSVRVVFANRSGFDAPIGVVLEWEERGSCLNIFQTKNCGRTSETFTNYEAKYLLCKSVDHVLKYSGRQIALGSQKPSRIKWQKTCCASETNTSVRVVFANRSGFDAPIAVGMVWEQRGSRINIFRMRNYGRISETFMNYEAKDLLRKSVDHVLTYSGRQIVVISQKPSRITRQKACCASESNTSVRVVFANRSGFGAPIVVDMKPSQMTRQKTCFASESNTSVRVVLANRSGFDAPIGVVLAWEERGSCLNIFRATNHVSQTRRFALYLRTGVVLLLQLDSSWHGRSVDHVLTYSGRQIVVVSQKPSRITRQKACCASESNTSIRVVFAKRSCFDAPIGYILAWEERGSCLNIFRTTNCGRFSETFTNYEAKDLLRKSVDHVLTYSGRQIVVVCQKPSRITRQKACCASESNTSVRVVFANRSGFGAPIAVVLAWEECGSCLNKFCTTNRGWILETFTNYEAKDLLRKSVDHVLTCSGRQIAVVSQKPSRIMRQKTCCASESNTLVRVVFANRSGFEAPIGVVLAWKERGSCLNIFRTTNYCRFSETFTHYEAKGLLRQNLHELRSKRLVAQVSQTRRFALYLQTVVVLMLQLESSWHGRSVDHVLTCSGRQIAVVSQKPSRIMRQKTCCASESNTLVRVVFANRSGFEAPIGVVLAWEERGSCLNIFRTTNRGPISETFTNYEAKD
ncbi:uncharacterized protein G2W53_041740 [Senna tora]|uniref:Uncharacterized protein n=1 Tax=Senna tora TaxID=362788 RepID=A0A834SFQ1_9FABA|nr:uncharacterized protein G2W53_041740 [Senna tora]